MKKRKIDSLKLNKRTISKLEGSSIKGGTVLTYTCTFGEICLAAAAVVAGVIDGMNEAGNECDCNE